MFAPPTQGQWRPPDQTVTVGQMWRAATPGVMIPLIVGALLNPLSVVMFGVAALLAGRVQYRVAQVRRVFGWSIGLITAVGRPDMAQAGGNDPAGLPAALRSVQAFVGERL